MIRLADAVVLSYTKLRVHRIRTGITVGIAGILFGILLLVVIVTQGIFNSLDRFSEEGLNSRYVVSITYMGHMTNDLYELSEDKAFIAEVEAEYNDLIAKKQRAATKHNVTYIAETDDPSPVVVDPTTRQKTIAYDDFEHPAVRAAVDKRYDKSNKPFDVKNYLSSYKSVTLRGTSNALMPADGALLHMKSGKEDSGEDTVKQQQMMYGDSTDPMLMVLDGSVTKPFITESFDTSKQEIPAIIPYGQAEKLLGYKKLASTASNAEKYKRLTEVRSRVGEITASFCYRNAASQQLLAQAISQRAAAKSTTPGSQSLTIEYSVPDASSCGAVTTISDRRTAAEKAAEQNQVAFEKEIGTYTGDPEQHKITVRGVGIAGDYAEMSSFSVAQLVQSLLTSPLGYGTWTIPSDLLEKVAESARPEAVFEARESDKRDSIATHLVEFGDKREARAFLQKYNSFGGGSGSEVFVMQFGSNSLLYDEMRTWASKIIAWLLIGIGGVAIVILTGMIGRTVSDGRKESAVFRAIGARRSDIASIYGMYALLLGLRIVLFAAVLGGCLALLLEILYSRDATLGAQIAYASSEVSKEFHFIGINSWYILTIAAVIIASSLLASIIPILRNARRNPIQDMRDE